MPNQNGELTKADLNPATKTRADARKKERQEQAKAEADAKEAQERSFTPQQKEFKQRAQYLRDKVSEMQLRPSETLKLNNAIDDMEKAAGFDPGVSVKAPQPVEHKQPETSQP